MALFEKPVMYFDTQGVFKIADDHRQCQVNQAIAFQIYQRYPISGMVPQYCICCFLGWFTYD